MENADQAVILITRADDMGYTHTGNLAIMDCLRAGFIKSTAIQAVAPWFEEAAKMAGENPQFCYGVHLALVGEWRGYRWRPVLPYSEVRTLVDEDGYLWPSPVELWANNPDPAEIEKEFKAQVALVLKRGVKVDYLDTHYMMPDNPRIRPICERVGKHFGIPISCLHGEKMLDDFGIYSIAPEEKAPRLVRILQSLAPGVHLLIAHPGYPSLENDALVHSDPNDVQALGTGRLRAAETVVYTSARIQQLVVERGIKLMSYREFFAR